MTDPLRCDLCPHRCRLRAGMFGRCRARQACGGRIVSRNYGVVTAMALDPIEKKPLRRFHPGTYILSVGSFGCNLRCPYCQNHAISMCGPEGVPGSRISPAQLTAAALALRDRAPGNIGVAFTYNEPLLAPDYLRDCSRLLRARGLYTVVVTNGCFLLPAVRDLLPAVDAFNIDLKDLSPAGYRRLGGNRDAVLALISAAAAVSHVEITTLIVPGRTDDPALIRELARTLAAISPQLPLHLTRCFPAYRRPDLTPPSPETIYALCAAAAEELEFVYPGNV